MPKSKMNPKLRKCAKSKCSAKLAAVDASFKKITALSKKAKQNKSTTYNPFKHMSSFVKNSIELGDCCMEKCREFMPPETTQKYELLRKQNQRHRK